MNKNMIYVAVLAVLCTLAGALAGASIASKTMLPPPPPNFAERAEQIMGPGRHFRGQRQGHDRLFEKLSVELNLDENQKVKVKEIVERTRKDMDKIGENVRTAISEVREKSDKEIMALLTPEQQEKFKTLLEEPRVGLGFGGPRQWRGPMAQPGQNQQQEELPPPPQE